MKKNLVALVSGLIFAIGLGISGMTSPEKILGFLDIFGNWNPTLAFVMFGAVLVHFIFIKLIRNRKTPILATEWRLPAKGNITFSLISGSFLFGVGWALGGYCPGPAFVSLASFDQRPAIFVSSMVVGMFVFRWFDRKYKFLK